MQAPVFAAPLHTCVYASVLMSAADVSAAADVRCSAAMARLAGASIGCSTQGPALSLPPHPPAFPGSSQGANKKGCGESPEALLPGGIISRGP
jgi:hypothetical protein